MRQPRILADAIRKWCFPVLRRALLVGGLHLLIGALSARVPIFQMQLPRLIDHNGRSPNGLATLPSIVSNCISNGCADIFLLRNLSGPLVHVLLVLLESDPYLHDKLLKLARPGACKREIDDRYSGVLPQDDAELLRPMSESLLGFDHAGCFCAAATGVLKTASRASRSARNRAVFSRVAARAASYSAIACCPSRCCCSFFLKAASARSRTR
jgi:hypothetical protein